jgi:hypothetical protein
MKKFKGTTLITRYDQDGKEQETIVVPNFEDRFSWWLFSVAILLGLAIFGQMI